MSCLKFRKLHEKAILPSRGSNYSCGLDLYSIESVTLASLDRAAVKTGLAVEIPQGHYGRVAPRSGLALKAGIDVLAGVIDADYRGELRCVLVNLGTEIFKINEGDKIAQLIIESVSMLSPVWSVELSETERSDKGFGSSGLSLTQK